jgi:hypothetical protein
VGRRALPDPHEPSPALRPPPPPVARAPPGLPVIPRGPSRQRKRRKSRTFRDFIPSRDGDRRDAGSAASRRIASRRHRVGAPTDAPAGTATGCYAQVKGCVVRIRGAASTALVSLSLLFSLAIYDPQCCGWDPISGGSCVVRWAHMEALEMSWSRYFESQTNKLSLG